MYRPSGGSHDRSLDAVNPSYSEAAVWEDQDSCRAVFGLSLYLGFIFINYL